MNYTLDSLFGVKDEVIVVCGGTRGIGREIANGLAGIRERTGREKPTVIT